VQSGESVAAISACNEFLLMGAGRSVLGYAKKCQKTPKNATPSQSHHTLRRWAEDFKWKERAVEFDKQENSVKAAERARAMREGLALDYKRVELLQKLADVLYSEIMEQGLPKEKKVRVECPECFNQFEAATGDLVRPYHNIWLPDVKSVGSGEFAERVDIERFNGAIISEFRSVCNDLAQETGGRKLNFVDKVLSRLDYSRMPVDVVQRIAHAENPEDVIVELIEQYVYSSAPATTSNHEPPRSETP
jgi:hypothetical protein